MKKIIFAVIILLIGGMIMSYTRVNWQNAPSTATPVNAENLNKMDKGIADAHSQLASNVSVLGGDNKNLWYPPMQPSSDEIVQGLNLSAYEALWENLRLEFPNYITKTLLGKDQTGVYDIYKYIFEPENYEKTIIITSNVHGSEVIGQKILYRFLWHVCHDSDTYTQLNYLRNKVRIVVIPIANPAGLVAGTRQNGNNVDINRNFQYGWNDFTPDSTTPKGTAPLSEAETQYINTAMAQYKAEGAVAYIDVHNTGPISPAENTITFYCPVPRYGNVDINYISQIADELTPDGYTTVKMIERTKEPIGPNQANMIYGMQSCSVEWQPGSKYGVAANTGEDIQMGLTFIGNVILQATTKQKPLKESFTKPWAIEKGSNSTSFNTASTGAWEPIGAINHVFTPKVDGLLIVEYELTYHNTTIESQNFLSLAITQPGNFILTPSAISEQHYRSDAYTEPGGKRDTISVSRVVPIYAGHTNFGDVTIQPYWKCDQGVMGHRRSRLHITFIPSDLGTRYEQHYINASGVMVKYFPEEVN